MSKNVRFWGLAALLLLISLMGTLVLAQDEPLVLQDFEGDAEIIEVYQVEGSIEAGVLSEVSTEGEWHTIGVVFSGAPVDVSSYGEFCFDINDSTAAGSTVGVKLFDASGANQEKWTDHEGVGVNPKTATGEWVTMCLNLSAFTDIDLTTLEHVEFAMFAAGTYQFDNLIAQAATDDPAATPEATEEPINLEDMMLQLTTVQGFEAGEPFYENYQAEELALSTDVVNSGSSSLMMTSPAGEWHAFGTYPEPRPFDASGYDVICFSVYDTTANNNGLADNSIGVRLFDTNLIDQEAWTDHVGAGDNPKTVTNEWVQMCINLDLYQNIDLTQVDKIQFSVYWAGTYYVDDVAFGKWVPKPAEGDLVQGFEAEDTYYAHYQAETSLSTEIFHSGASSLMATSSEGEWHSFGAYPEPRPFDASGYEKICFYFMDTTTNNNGLADNSVGVRIFDARLIDQEAWTDHVGAGDNPKTVTDEWVQMCINLDLYSNLDLTQVDKIEFSMYWAGTYYVDDVIFVPAAAE
ncbi:MAG: hypothetical protein IPO91_22310 [Chloroflexi bacterium]|nr:hypothetical protein [Chloroflexota bacterium]